MISHGISRKDFVYELDEAGMEKLDVLAWLLLPKRLEFVKEGEDFDRIYKCLYCESMLSYHKDSFGSHITAHVADVGLEPSVVVYVSKGPGY